MRKDAADMTQGNTPHPASTTVSSPLSRCDSLWLHGAGLAGDTWRTVTAHLPRASTPNLPGHGDAPNLDPPRVETYADALVETVPAGAVLIGHSLGGMIALELTARMGNRIAALVLIEAVPTVRDRLTSRFGATLAARLFGLMPPGWFTSLSTLGQPPETKAELRRQLGRMNAARISAALEAALRYDGRRHLAKIAVPTLVIIGTRDTATHRGAGMIADMVPGARLMTLRGGHMLHTENPKGLRAAIEDFLADTLPTPERRQ